MGKKPVVRHFFKRERFPIAHPKAYQAVTALSAQYNVARKPAKRAKKTKGRPHTIAVPFSGYGIIQRITTCFVINPFSVLIFTK